MEKVCIKAVTLLERWK